MAIEIKGNDRNKAAMKYAARLGYTSLIEASKKHPAYTDQKLGAMADKRTRKGWTYDLV